MDEIFAQYYPELIISCSIFLCLIFALFKNKLSDMMNFTLMVGVLLLSFLILMKQPVSTYPDSVLIKENFTNYLKFLILICFVSIIVILRKSLNDFHIETREFPVLLLASLLGSFLLVSANSLTLIFLSLELTSLCAYIMCSMLTKAHQATEAAMKYIILGALSTAFFVFGAALIYGGSNSLSLHEITTSLKIHPEISLFLRLGCVFILISLFLKLSAAPFHLWLPDVFQGVPLAVVTFISTVPKIAIVGIVMRLLYGPFDLIRQDWQPIIAICGLMSVGWGTLAALHQTNLKRLFAYSSIAHTGFIILPLINQNIHSLQASLIYLSFYLMIMLSVFLILLWFKRLGHKIEDIKDLCNINRSYPGVMILFSLLVISLSGIPPFSGFFIKFYVIAAFVESKQSAIAIYLLIMSVVGIYYYFKIIRDIYFNDITHKVLQNQSLKDPLAFFTMSGIGLISVAAFWIPPIYDLFLRLIYQAVGSLMAA